MKKQMTLKVYALNRRDKNGNYADFEEIPLSNIKCALTRYAGYAYKVTKLKFNDVPLDFYTNPMLLDSLCIAPVKTQPKHAEIQLFSKLFTRDCLYEDVARPCTQDDVVYELVATLQDE